MRLASAFFVRWRVRLGYPLAAAVLLLARPVPRAILWGSLVGALGLGIRGYAAGFLRKQESLTTTGPYAYTRNPLYLGSAFLALGLAIATESWFAAFLIAAYFALFYSIAMRREEGELRGQFGSAFDEYAQRVPMFFPRPRRPAGGTHEKSSFSWGQYRRNREYQAAIGFALILALLVLICGLRSR